MLRGQRRRSTEPTMGVWHGQRRIQRRLDRRRATVRLVLSQRESAQTQGDDAGPTCKVSRTISECSKEAASRAGYIFCIDSGQAEYDWANGKGSQASEKSHKSSETCTIVVTTVAPNWIRCSISHPCCHSPRSSAATICCARRWAVCDKPGASINAISVSYSDGSSGSSMIGVR